MAYALLNLCLKEQSREILAQESADLHKDHWCHHVNIFEVKQLAGEVIILKLIVTSYGEVRCPFAQPNRVYTPNSPNFGLQ